MLLMRAILRARSIGSYFGQWPPCRGAPLFEDTRWSGKSNAHSGVCGLGRAVSPGDKSRRSFSIWAMEHDAPVAEGHKCSAFRRCMARPMPGFVLAKRLRLGSRDDRQDQSRDTRRSARFRTVFARRRAAENAATPEAWPRRRFPFA